MPRSRPRNWSPTSKNALPGNTCRKACPSPRIIAKHQRQLPPLAAPEPTPLPPAAKPETFSVAAYAKAHGLDGREIRKKLRATGKRAPYTVADVEAVR